MQKKIILLIIILLFSLRLFSFGTIPVGLYWDEVAILVDAKAMAATGRDMHGNHAIQAIFPSYGDYKLPVYIWLASLFVKLFGASESVVRLPSLLAGALTVWATWKIFEILLEKKEKQYAAVAAFVVTVLPWSFMFSRTAFEGHVGQALLVLSMYALLTAKNKKQLILSIMIGALSVYAYFSVRFVWPVVFLAGLVLKESKVSKKLLSKTVILKICFKIFIGFTLFTVLLLPLTLSPFADPSDQVRYSTDSILKNDSEILQSNVYRELSGKSLIDRVFFHRTLLTGRELTKNYSDLLSFEYLFIQGDPNLRHGTGFHGVLLLSFAPFLIWGIWSLFIHQRKVGLFLFVWWLIALLPAAIPNDTPHSLRSLNALVPISLIISFGIVQLIKTVSASRFKNLLIVLTFSFFVIEFAGFAHYYFLIYPETSALSWQDNYSALANAVVSHKDSEEFIWVEPFDDRFFLWLLAHESYSGKEFTDWTSENFQYTSFENITTNQPFNWSELDSNNGRFTIIGTVDHMEKKLASLDFETNIRSQRIINDSFGRPQFLLVQFGE